MFFVYIYIHMHTHTHTHTHTHIYIYIYIYIYYKSLLLGLPCHQFFFIYCHITLEKKFSTSKSLSKVPQSWTLTKLKLKKT